MVVVAFLVLLLIVLLLGGLGFVAHLIWIAMVIALVVWLVGFFVSAAEGGLTGGRRRWYGRW